MATARVKHATDVLITRKCPLNTQKREHTLAAEGALAVANDFPDEGVVLHHGEGGSFLSVLPPTTRRHANKGSGRQSEATHHTQQTALSTRTESNESKVNNATKQHAKERE